MMKKIGDWIKVGRLVANIGGEMKKAQQESLRNFGMKVERIAVEHMSSQDLGWRRLKPATLARKIRKGYSENILIETSTYFQSITSWVDGDKVQAGVKRGVREASGIEVADLAAIHEFGSRSGNIPARPLWQPSFEEALAWHRIHNSPVTIFMNKIRRYL